MHNVHPEEVFGRPKNISESSLMSNELGCGKLLYLMNKGMLYHLSVLQRRCIVDYSLNKKFYTCHILETTLDNRAIAIQVIDKVPIVMDIPWWQMGK